MVFPGKENVSNFLHHHGLLVPDDDRIQNVPATETPPALEATVSTVILRIPKLIRNHQSSTSWARHRHFLLTTVCVSSWPSPLLAPDVQLTRHRLVINRIIDPIGGLLRPSQGAQIRHRPPDRLPLATLH